MKNKYSNYQIHTSQNYYIESNSSIMKQKYNMKLRGK
jgi:hypothetical protein